jgi:hypothetical protein
VFSPPFQGKCLAIQASVVMNHLLPQVSRKHVGFVQREDHEHVHGPRANPVELVPGFIFFFDLYIL